MASSTEMALWRILPVGPDGYVEIQPEEDAATVEAGDGFEALQVYCDENEMAPYRRAETDEEYDAMMNDGDGPAPAHYSAAHGAWVGVWTDHSIGAFPVRRMTVDVDVTGLTEKQVEHLGFTMSVQSESDRDEDFPGTPGVPEVEVEPPFPQVPRRTILVHLNVETTGNDQRTGDEIADAVIRQIEAGLVVDPGDLASGNSVLYDSLEICVPLAEEV